ncbi:MULTISPECIES: tetratricopeptide repeat protein [Acetobacter]|uniref:tetratricopeptide repeat protein n=1 Tax=Acetobacter TaxID=434 RepID=UPI000A37B846|nr:MULTISPECIES: tetratricopeptide repeat protein [Acetobacter]MBS0980214.1 tetratricopeptide repeat protein [Acetobacter thailandicus]OUI89199.1 thioredoxin [Acetobacter sp. DmW_043]OUJ10629.1 thioredoxin [Acetobacter sp. DsW_059]
MNQIIGQSLQGKPAGAPSSDNTPVISEGSQATFMKDVIEASKTVPVLVDFWAEWCNICKKLAPVLERVVTSAKGRVRLVKIDVEANQSLAAQLAQAGLPLQSIPMVAVFWKGQILDMFQGAPSESEIKKFIENVVKNTGGGPLPTTELMSEADTALEAGKPEEAAGLYSTVIGEELENAKAWSGLIRALLALDDEESALAALEDVPEAIAKHPDIEGARAALELKKEGRKAAEQSEEIHARLAANPDDFEARCELATALNVAGKREEAAEQLLYIIKTDNTWNDGAAKQQLLRFFEAWGHTDPVTLTSRRKLSSFLFS